VKRYGGTQEVKEVNNGLDEFREDGSDQWPLNTGLTTGSGQELPKPHAVGDCASELIFLIFLPKPLVLAAVGGRTLIIFAKIQPNHRDANFINDRIDTHS